MSQTLRKARRGFFGKLTLFVFWLFNALMVWWIWQGSKDVIEKQKGLTEAEKMGSDIGLGIGITFILIVWACGALIFGLMAILTRPKG